MTKEELVKDGIIEKDALRVVEILEKKYPNHTFDWQSKSGRFWALCPNPKHHDTHPTNFNIYKGEDNKWHWKCFACGISGPRPADLSPVEGDVDILKKDLMEQVKKENQLGYSYLTNRIDIDYLSEEQTQSFLFDIFEIGYYFYDPKFVGNFSSNFKAIVPKKVPILWERTNHEWLVFPYRNVNDGSIVELKFRNIWLKKGTPEWDAVGQKIVRLESEKKEKKGVVPIFGYKNIYSESPVLFLVEGEFDAITTTIVTNGSYPAIALGGTGRFKKETIEQITKKAKGKAIVVLPDWDKAGQETLYRLVDALDEEFLKKNKLFTILNSPDGSKDMDEYLRNKQDYLVQDAMSDLLKEENIVPLAKIKEQKEKEKKDKLEEIYNQYPPIVRKIAGVEAYEENKVITDADVLSKQYKKEDPIFDIFYRGINILAGDTGVGKSYTLLRLAIEFTQKTKQKVLLVFYEDEEGEFFQKRLNFAIEDYCVKNGKDRKDYIPGLLDIQFYYPPIFLKEFGELRKNEHFQEFKKDIETHGLICIDPLLSFVGITELDSSLLRSALVDIKTLMSGNQKYLIFSHHVTKDVENVTKIAEKHFFHKEDLVKLRIVIRGSGEIVNVARNVAFTLPSPPQEGKNVVRLVTVKSNVAPVNIIKRVTLPWGGYEEYEDLEKEHIPSIPKQNKTRKYNFGGSVS